MAKVRIRYRGISDVRTIDQETLAGLGITVDRDLVWSRLNRFSVDIDADDRLIDLINAQGAFQVDALTDDGRSADRIILPSLRDETNILLDGRSGQRSRRKE